MAEQAATKRAKHYRDTHSLSGSHPNALSPTVESMTSLVTETILSASMIRWKMAAKQVLLESLDPTKSSFRIFLWHSACDHALIEVVEDLHSSLQIREWNC
jgi:hypothetical protein